MGSKSPIGETGGSGWPAQASKAELMDEIARLARQAGDAFATASDLRDWIVCVIHQRRFGVPRRAGVGCEAVSAAACAIGLRGECPMASAPREFDELVSGLPTPRLEALLALGHEAFGRR